MKPVLILLLVAQISLFAKDEVQIETIKINENIYMLIGDGGNIGLCVGEDGAFMIDDQYAPLTEKIKGAVSAVSKYPVKFLINTHYHFDHAGGNENFGKTAAVIVAHENVRTRLSAGQFMKDFDMQVEPTGKPGLPVITFTQNMTFHLNGEEIQVRHVPRAHTDGDSVIFFKNANVLHTGDIFFNGRYPYFDIHAGGALDGVIEVTTQLLKEINSETRIIPGHGPLAGKAELRAYRDMLADVRNKVMALINQDKTLQEVIDAAPAAAHAEAWGKRANGFVKLVYNDLIRKRK